MASPRTRQVLQGLRTKLDNNTCFECGALNPQWVSISYAVFICLECSGKHRSLGTHLSFVRSTTMDKWKDMELEKMRVGGNRQARQFLESQPDIHPGMSLQDKYNSRAAALYRDKIHTLASGHTWTEEESPAWHYRPPSRSVAANSREQAESLQALEDFLEDSPHPTAKPSCQPHSVHEEPSRYIGFGNTPQKLESDSPGTWSSLQSGWESFTSGASTWASQASQGVSRIGQAMQENVIRPGAAQAHKVGNYLSGSVVQPVKQKVQEKELWSSMSSSASQLVAKVKTSGEKGWDNLSTWIHGGETSLSSRDGEAGVEEEGACHGHKEQDEEDGCHNDLLINLEDSSPPVSRQSQSVKAHQPSESGSQLAGRGGWEDWGSEWDWETNQHN